MFLSDDETQSIIMIGEIGGSAEEDAADFLMREAQKGRKKADGRFHCRRDGTSGPEDGSCRRNLSGGKGKAEDKLAAMKAAGIAIAPSPGCARSVLSSKF